MWRHPKEDHPWTAWWTESSQQQLSSSVPLASSVESQWLASKMMQNNGNESFYTSLVSQETSFSHALPSTIRMKFTLVHFTISACSFHDQLSCLWNFSVTETVIIYNSRTKGNLFLFTWMGTLHFDPSVTWSSGSDRWQFDNIDSYRYAKCASSPTKRMAQRHLNIIRHLLPVSSDTNIHKERAIIPLC